MSNLGRPISKILSIDEAEKLLSPHIDEIILAVRGGLKQFQLIPPWLRSKMKARSFSSVLNDLIVADALIRFGEQEPAIRICEDFEGTIFTFSDKAAIRFKKGGKRLKGSNIRTNRQLGIEYQLEIEGIIPCTHLSVIYVPNETFTQILNVHVVCWRGEIRLWVLTISDAIDPSVDAPTTFKPPAFTPPKTKRPPVKSKGSAKKKKKKGG